MTSNASQAPWPPRRVKFGPYEIDLYTQELWKHGTRIKLAGQPFQILAILVSHPGELVTREELQQHLWSEETFSDSNHGLNAAVNKLRETLHDAASNPRYIETLPRRGYRFIGAIASPAPERTKATVPDLPVSIVQTASPRAWQQNTTSKLWAAGVPLLLVVIGVVALLTPSHKLERASTATDSENISNTAAADAVPDIAPQQAANRDRKHTKVAAARQAYSEPPPVFREANTSEPPTVRTIISDAGGNAAPQFSPDGHRIAFMSDRSGPWQIWVSNVDGSDPVQLSHTESAGTPRWSPDGRSIAFDAPSDKGTSIFVILSDGRARAQRLIGGQVPSFSRDGRWIYFASDRSGDLQVWKIPVTGGAAQQVTRNGGFAALEGTDGYLYYTKQPGNNPEICRMPVSGDNENCTLSHLRPRTWSSWAVTRHGILFAEDMPGGKSALSMYEPARQQVRDLVWLPSPPVWMGARPDGTQAIINDNAERRISVVENLR